MGEIANWVLGVVTLISTSAFAWAFAINSKVNVHDKQIEAAKELVDIKQDDLKELINEKFDGVDEKFVFVVQRLERIERGMNGYIKGH